MKYKENTNKKDSLFIHCFYKPLNINLYLDFFITNFYMEFYL